MSVSLYEILKSLSDLTFYLSPILFLVVSIVTLTAIKKKAIPILILSLFMGLFSIAGLPDMAEGNMMAGLTLVGYAFYSCSWALSPPLLVSAYILYERDKTNRKIPIALFTIGLCLLSINIARYTVVKQTGVDNKLFWATVFAADLHDLDKETYERHLTKEDRKNFNLKLTAGCRNHMSSDVVGRLFDLNLDVRECDNLPEKVSEHYAETGDIIKELNAENYKSNKLLKSRLEIIKKVNKQTSIRKLPFKVQFENNVLAFELDNIEDFLRRYPDYNSNQDSLHKDPYAKLVAPALNMIARHSDNDQELRRVAEITFDNYLDGDAYIFTSLCLNENAPSDLIESVIRFYTDEGAEHKNRSCIWKASTNPNINEETFNILLDRNGKAAIANPSISDEVIFTLLDDAREGSREFILSGLASLIKRGSISDEQVIYYLDKAFTVKVDVPSAHNYGKLEKRDYYYGGIPDEILKYLALNLDDIDALYEVTGRGHLSRDEKIDFVKALPNDKKMILAEGKGRHFHRPYTLKVLSKDPDPTIATLATTKLNELLKNRGLDDIKY